ncbi:hypothetical protein MMC21_008160 [Puttea exsequens]|nr:hypothetical protein [Puttea exsequens]
MLPILNQTADKIFDRIIPAPNGDCLLVAHSGVEKLPDYNVEVTGLPSEIVCELKPDAKVGGVIVPPGNGTGPGGGDCPHASKQTAFKKLDPDHYACLAKSDGDDPPFCLPPGKYQGQGEMGFKMGDVDTLKFPSSGDWNFTIHFENAPQYRSSRPQGSTTRSWTQSQKPDPDVLKIDMDAVDQNRDDQAWFSIDGPDGPDPVCCLFTEVSGGGNAWCAGVGGGDLPEHFQEKVQSIDCWGQGQVWLFVGGYGKNCGANIPGSAADLRDYPYGNDQKTYSKKATAAWILKA